MDLDKATTAGSHEECEQCHPERTVKGDLVVQTKDLHVSCGGNAVLRGVNLEIPRGEIVALIGPNGSGKTTLLRCLLGLQRPDRGEVRVFGEAEPRSYLKRVGYVPQKIGLERSFILS